MIKRLTPLLLLPLLLVILSAFRFSTKPSGNFYCPETAALKVAYLYKNISADPAAAPQNEDAVIKMLQADPNFEVTPIGSTGSDVIDLAGYDLVIVQESFGSGDAILKRAGSLGLKNIPVPFIYNKTFALRDGRAISQANPAAAVTETSDLEITVQPADQNNPLFSGLTFTDNKIAIYKSTASDQGGEGAKSLNPLTLLKLSNNGNPVNGTLLATAGAITDYNTSILVNDIPAGTQLGDNAEDVIQARMIALAFNYGASIKDGGDNITDQGLTIWRNAAYVLAGLPVPASPVITNPAASSDASLSDLAIGGITLAGFEPGKLSYDLELPSGTTAVPVVTATPTDAKATVAILPAAALPGTTSVSVTAEDSVTQQTYVVNFSLAADMGVNAAGAITWPFESGTAGQVAVYSDTIKDYFKPDYVSLGGQLNYNNSRTNSTLGVTYTLFRPVTQLNEPSSENLIAFNLTPVTGLTFSPTGIAFDLERFGTDGGVIDVVWKSSDGTRTTVQAGIIPARTGGSSNPGVYHVDLTGLVLPASDGLCALELYLYKLGNTKDVGLANIVLSGTVSGEITQVTTYNISTSVTPEGAGTITSFPVGDALDAGTEITLTANRNFGYAFSHWADGSGQQVSTDNPYSFTLSQNTTLQAVFDVLNTYSLDVTVTGGGKDYMISYAPEGTKVDGKRMYEAGVNVTLSATGNPVVLFNNWSSGQTGTDLVINMDTDQSVQAIFSTVDYIVGWDFYNAGNNGRVADFASKPDNESAALILRKEDGTTAGWLDKSQVFGGYEGQPAAVNWQALTDRYYYQISFNASDFTDIVVAADMAFNFNAYSVQKCEYSLDGTNFTPLGLYEMTNAKFYYHKEFALPSDADNQPLVYVRWIPDYDSPIVGATTDRDGTALSAVYVTGKEALVNDGVAPKLVTAVPSNGATGASATGKMVLTFDEKVKTAEGALAALGSQSIAPVVSGATITFPYRGLEYNTTYEFVLPGGSVSDLTENVLTDTIRISFTTLARPVVEKRDYDFIVGIDGDLKAAFDAAKAASESGNRFYIFFPNGEYDLGNSTGDGTQQTFFTLPNVSFIGQSMDSVVLFNKPLPANEGIGTTPTLYLTTTADNIYMQDITLLNKMDFRSGSFQGRAVALRDQGAKNIFKQVKLLSNQDTYYTGSERTYWENGEIHGTVDFIFGGGDVFFNETRIYLEDRNGNVITAAATSSDWGYVFRDCIIDGAPNTDGNYRLGRPWQNAPKTVFINTTMKVLPAADGWSTWNVLPAVYAEFNSMTASGGIVDLSNRRSRYTTATDTTDLAPLLTREQADSYSIDNVLGGADAWQPRLFTEQAPAPVIALTDTALTWDDNEYVLGWAVIRNGVFIDFITNNYYTIPEGVTSGVYTVRAANAMGGLGEASNAINLNATGITDALFPLEVKVFPNPTRQTVTVQLPETASKANIRLMGMDGRLLLQADMNQSSMELDLNAVAPGLYLLVINSAGQNAVQKIVKQ